MKNTSGKGQGFYEELRFRVLLSIPFWQTILTKPIISLTTDFAALVGAAVVYIMAIAVWLLQKNAIIIYKNPKMILFLWVLEWCFLPSYILLLTWIIYSSRYIN